MTFDYSNLPPRRGRFVTWAGRVYPGVAHVQDEVEPYAAAWARANAVALAERGDRPLWVALGDSLTQGIGAGAYDRGWVGQLRDRLAAAGREHAVVNLGVSGAKTVDVLERQLPVLDTLDADLVTLMIGSNDLMRPHNRALLPARFEKILRRLPRGAIVTTLPNPAAPARQASDTLLRLAPELGLVVAELRDPRTSSWRGKLAADHFHPNELGHAALADVVADVVPGLEEAA